MVLKPKEKQVATELGADGTKEKTRFQIVKLEERIAPNQGGISNGGRDWGYYKPCHGAHGKCFP